MNRGIGRYKFRAATLTRHQKGKMGRRKGERVQTRWPRPHAPADKYGTEILFASKRVESGGNCVVGRNKKYAEIMESMEMCEVAGIMQTFLRQIDWGKNPLLPGELHEDTSPRGKTKMRELGLKWRSCCAVG